MIVVSDSGHNAITILYFHYDGDREHTDVHGHAYLANISKTLTNLLFYMCTYAHMYIHAYYIVCLTYEFLHVHTYMYHL